MTSVRSRIAIALGVALFAAPLSPQAYPLDGYPSTGLARLEAQRMVQEGQAKGKKRPPGELLPLDEVDLRLLDHKDLVIPSPDPGLSATLKRLIGPGASRYGLALLDLSDLNNPRYAELNGGQKQNPGSVGKILVALGIFQALADHFPNVEDRIRVLRTAIITADMFSVYDHHTVPFYDVERRTYKRRPIQEGDQASLYTYLDWMMSPSSNSAAGMMQKQLIVMSHFGSAYPPTAEAEKKFFDDHSTQQLKDIFAKAIQEPVTRNGLDLNEIRQGSFFTRNGKRRIPGTSSYATARALVKFMLKMEQGKLVDEFSSREIKRLLYITERRIRYGSSGALRKSAVYFKSGSLYSCVEEPGFKCKKYHGNKRNYMNSAALIETPAGGSRLFYMVSVLSNVLKKNSAQDHRDLARAIHGKLLNDHPATAAHKREMADYGKGFIGYAAERSSLQVAVATQEALLDLGYDIGDIDGAIGPNTRKAIREFQKSQGLPANGQASQALVNAMQKVARQKGLARPASGG